MRSSDWGFTPTVKVTLSPFSPDLADGSNTLSSPMSSHAPLDVTVISSDVPPAAAKAYSVALSEMEASVTGGSGFCGSSTFLSSPHDHASIAEASRIRYFFILI